MHAEFKQMVGKIAVGRQRLRPHPDPSAPRFSYCLGTREPSGRFHWSSMRAFDSLETAVAAAKGLSHRETAREEE